MKKILVGVITLLAITGTALASYPAWSSWVSATSGSWQVRFRTPVSFVQDAYARFQVQIIWNGGGTVYIDHVNVKFMESEAFGTTKTDYDQNHLSAGFYSGTVFDGTLVTTGYVNESDNTEEAFARVVIYLAVGSTEISTPTINIDRYGDDTYENNDTYSTAYAITGGSYGPLIMADADDWYKFTVGSTYRNVEAKIYNFYNSIGNLNLYLYGTDGTILLHSSTTTTNEEKVGVKNLAAGGTYFIKVHPASSGDKGFYDLTLYLYTGVEGEPHQIGPNYDFSISSYPNPARTHSTIEYTVGEPTRISVKLYNITGQHVATLVDGQQVNTGRYTLNWNGRTTRGEQILPGVYLLRMEYLGKSVTRKMISVE